MKNLLLNIDEYVFWTEKPTEFNEKVYTLIAEQTEKFKSQSIPYATSFYLISAYLENIEEPKHVYHGLTESEEIYIRRSTLHEFSYSNLSQNTLHTYFSWRTILRRILSDETLTRDEMESQIATVETNDYQLLLFSLEIFNLIWTKRPRLGYKYFNKFSVLFENINHVYFFKSFFEAYCFYYGFPHPFQKMFRSEESVNPVIEQMLNNEYHLLSEFYQKQTKYNYAASSFYSQPNGFLTEKLMPSVVQWVRNYLKVEHNFELFTIIGGKYSVSSFNPINTYPFMHNRFCAIPNGFNPHKMESYGLVGDSWKIYEFQFSRYGVAVISFLYKLTDRYLREYFKYYHQVVVNIDKYCDVKFSQSNEYVTFRKIVYSEEFNSYIKQKIFSYLNANKY